MIAVTLGNERCDHKKREKNKNSFSLHLQSTISLNSEQLGSSSNSFVLVGKSFLL